MNRFLILRQANFKYDQWERSGKHATDPAALQALALYREFHSTATDPFTRAFCAAFDAAMNTRGTTPAQRAGLVQSAGYGTAFVTQKFFDFFQTVVTTTAGRTA